MRGYISNGPQNGLNIGRKVGLCPGSRRRWVLGSVHACYQAVYAANTYRPRFQVRTRVNPGLTRVNDHASRKVRLGLGLGLTRGFR